MKQLLYFSFVSLFCAASVGCSPDESTIPQPERLPKLISEIRVESSNGVLLYNFMYDKQQRVRQQIITQSVGVNINTEICEYTYGSGRIDADRTLKGEKTHITYLLNNQGYCATIVYDDQAQFTPKYNPNGYFYEDPTTGVWHEYEYHMVGDKCNLFKIKEYDVSGSQIEQIMYPTLESIFEYGIQPNKANLDLFYPLMSAYYPSLLQAGMPMMFGWMGKRNSMMPVSQSTTHYYDSSSSSTLTTYTFAYKADADGYITQITKSLDNNIIETYRITYQ